MKNRNINLHSTLQIDASVGDKRFTINEGLFIKTVTMDYLTKLPFIFFLHNLQKIQNHGSSIGNRIFQRFFLIFLWCFSLVLELTVPQFWI
jgi:hypothetical protein